VFFWTSVAFSLQVTQIYNALSGRPCHKEESLTKNKKTRMSVVNVRVHPAEEKKAIAWLQDNNETFLVSSLGYYMSMVKTESLLFLQEVLDSLAQPSHASDIRVQLTGLTCGDIAGIILSYLLVPAHGTAKMYDPLLFAPSEPLSRYVRLCAMSSLEPHMIGLEEQRWYCGPKSDIMHPEKLDLVSCRLIKNSLRRLRQLLLRGGTPVRHAIEDMAQDVSMTACRFLHKSFPCFTTLSLDIADTKQVEGLIGFFDSLVDKGVIMLGKNLDGYNPLGNRTMQLKIGISFMFLAANGFGYSPNAAPLSGLE
jgi:hypothetical protein